MTSKRYLVTLTPIGKYFFGGENTFVSAAKDAKGKTKANYFARSNQYPQQTTLLGMLRYAILLQLDSLNEKAKNQQHLIGEHGFRIDHAGPYGILQKISPVFFIEGAGKERKYWLVAGMDKQEYHAYDENKKKIFVSDEHDKLKLTAKKEKVSISLAEQAAFLLPLLSPATNGAKQFDTKEPYETFLTNYTDNQEQINSEDVFTEAIQVGSKKNYEHKQEDEAFFKQSYYKLKPNFAFAFYVDVEDNNGFDFELLDDTFCPMGADGSEFKVNVEELQTGIKDVFKDIESKNDKARTNTPVKVTMLSDSMVDNSLFDYCRFAICDNTHFRHIETTVNTNRYYNLANKVKNDGAKRSASMYSLLSKGSVLYPQNIEDVIKKLNNIPFQNIGYNHYLIESIEP